MKTVKDLIEALQKLRPETIIWEKTYGSNCPIEGWEYGPIEIYRCGHDERLYIDDGEANHGDVDDCCKGIFD